MNMLNNSCIRAVFIAEDDLISRKLNHNHDPMFEKKAKLKTFARMRSKERLLSAKLYPLKNWYKKITPSIISI